MVALRKSLIMKNKKIVSSIIYLSIYYACVLFSITFSFFVIFGCDTHKKTKPCSQCPQYTEEIKRLNKKLMDDVIIIDQLGSDYMDLWQDNQQLTSIFAEIENKPGGREMLEDIYNSRN